MCVCVCVSSEWNTLRFIFTVYSIIIGFLQPCGWLVVVKYGPEFLENKNIISYVESSLLGTSLKMYEALASVVVMIVSLHFISFMRRYI